MMKALGTDIGTIHFVGIGGSGMSGIAGVMHQLGYNVQGSDVADSYVVGKLRKAGIRGSNARLGQGDWWVIEADESDGSFLRLDGTIAVVTNVDPEHLEHYGSFDAVKDAFVEFIENVPFYGLAVMCVDHPEVQGVLSRIRDRRVVTYGFSALADVRADNVTPVPGGSRFD